MLAVAGAVALVAVIALVWVLANGPRRPAESVYGHLEHFQALAEEHGDRAADSPGYEAAAEYVEEVLEDAGYVTERQYFTVDHDGEVFETFNVITETAAGDDEDVVMIGAHLDGVPGSPAINDNASGAAALLEAAKALSTQEEITTTVRFAWWGAEEYRRPYGSRHYVQDLAGQDELESIRAYLNIDMIASPNPIIGVYNAQDPDAWLDVPEGSVQIMEFLGGSFDDRGQPWAPTGWDIASDQQPFIRAGVPVGGWFTGSEERKSRREANTFGGIAKAPRDPNYHTAGDDLDNVDEQTLQIMSAAITDAATRLARDSSVLD